MELRQLERLRHESAGARSHIGCWSARAAGQARPAGCATQPRLRRGTLETRTVRHGAGTFHDLSQNVWARHGGDRSGHRRAVAAHALSRKPGFHIHGPLRADDEPERRRGTEPRMMISRRALLLAAPAAVLA